MRVKTSLKRIVSLIITIVMVLIIIPFSSMKVSAIAINGSFDFKSLHEKTATYELTSDITIKWGKDYVGKFGGILDGNGYTIFLKDDGGMGNDINGRKYKYGGIFGELNGTVKNLRVVVDEKLSYFDGPGSEASVGIIAGIMYRNAKVENCNILGEGDGAELYAENVGSNEEFYMGSVVGAARGGIISNCYSTLKLGAFNNRDARDKTSYSNNWHYVGGIVGHIDAKRDSRDVVEITRNVYNGYITMGKGSDKAVASQALFGGGIIGRADPIYNTIVRYNLLTYTTIDVSLLAHRSVSCYTIGRITGSNVNEDKTTDANAPYIVKNYKYLCSSYATYRNYMAVDIINDYNVQYDSPYGFYYDSEAEALAREGGFQLTATGTKVPNLSAAMAKEHVLPRVTVATDTNQNIVGTFYNAASTSSLRSPTILKNLDKSLQYRISYQAKKQLSTPQKVTVKKNIGEYSASNLVITSGDTVVGSLVDPTPFQCTATVDAVNRAASQVVTWSTPTDGVTIDSKTGLVTISKGFKGKFIVQATMPGVGAVTKEMTVTSPPAHALTAPAPVTENNVTATVSFSPTTAAYGQEVTATVSVLGNPTVTAQHLLGLASTTLGTITPGAPQVISVTNGTAASGSVSFKFKMPNRAVTASDLTLTNTFTNTTIYTLTPAPSKTVGGITATTAFQDAEGGTITGSVLGKKITAVVSLAGTTLKASDINVNLTSKAQVSAITPPAIVNFKTTAATAFSGEAKFTFIMPEKDVNDLVVALTVKDTVVVPPATKMAGNTAMPMNSEVKTPAPMGLVVKDNVTYNDTQTYVYKATTTDKDVQYRKVGDTSWIAYTTAIHNAGGFEVKSGENWELRCDEPNSITSGVVTLALAVPPVPDTTFVGGTKVYDKNNGLTGVVVIPNNSTNITTDWAKVDANGNVAKSMTLLKADKLQGGSGYKVEVMYDIDPYLRPTSYIGSAEGGVQSSLKAPEIVLNQRERTFTSELVGDPPKPTGVVIIEDVVGKNYDRITINNPNDAGKTKIKYSIDNGAAKDYSTEPPSFLYNATIPYKITAWVEDTSGKENPSTSTSVEYGQSNHSLANMPSLTIADAGGTITQAFTRQAQGESTKDYYSSKASITLKNNDTDFPAATATSAKIYYTLDGTTPTEQSAVYTAPITDLPSSNFTISAMTISDKVKSLERRIYVKVAGTLKSPVLVLPEGTVNTAIEQVQEIRFALSEEDARQYAHLINTPGFTVPEVTAKIFKVNPDGTSEEDTATSKKYKLSEITTAAGNEAVMSEPITIKTDPGQVIRCKASVSATLYGLALPTTSSDSELDLTTKPPCEPPTALPAPDDTKEFERNTKFALKTATPGGRIFYTTDGSVPVVADYGVDGKSTKLFETSVGITIDTLAANFQITALTAPAEGEKEILASKPVVFSYRIKGAELAKIPQSSPATTSENPTVLKKTDAISLYSADGGAIYYSLNGQPSIPVDEAQRYKGSFTPNDIGAGYGEVITIFTMATKTGLADSPVGLITYKVESAPGPVAPVKSSVSSGAVIKGSQITLTTATADAEIYYTTDGTIPTPNTTTLYDGLPLTIDSPMTITAIGYKNGVTSTVSTYKYTLIPIQGVKASKASGVVERGTEITLSCPTAGAEIYFEINGKTPDPATSQMYDGTPIVVSNDITINAIAHKNGMVSPVATFKYTVPPVQLVKASIVSGVVERGTQITLSCATPGAEIYVETDGKTPDPATSQMYDGTPIVIDSNTIIKALAVVNGVQSQVSTFTYTMASVLNTPTASLVSGAVVANGTKVKLTADAGATIVYTNDGSDPKKVDNPSNMIGSELLVTGSAGKSITFRVYASKKGATSSEVATFTYTISSVEGGVVAYPAPNAKEPIKSGTSITLTSPISNAKIYYTTNGENPTISSSSGTNVTLTGAAGSTVVVKAIAVVNNTDTPNPVTFTYTFRNKTSNPTITGIPTGSKVLPGAKVGITASEGIIYYTTDGTTPTASSQQYTDKIEITTSMIIRAIAVADGLEASDVTEAVYTIAGIALPPVANVASGPIEVGKEVTLTTQTEGATIYYSTNNTDPTVENIKELSIYNGPIKISNSVTLKAFVYKQGMQASAVNILTYTVIEPPKVEEPVEEEDKNKETNTDRLTSRRSYANQTSGPIFTGLVLRSGSDVDGIVSSEKNVIPDKSILDIQEIQAFNSDRQSVKNKLGEYDIVSLFDVNILLGGVKTQPNGQVEIGIPIPADFENSVISICRLNDDGSVDIFPTRRVAGYAYVIVDHFSKYAIVTPTRDAAQEFTLSPIMIIAACVIVLALGVIVFVFIRRRKKQNLA